MYGLQVVERDPDCTLFEFDIEEFVCLKRLEQLVAMELSAQRCRDLLQTNTVMRLNILE